MQKAKGAFTLAEVLITITIIGVIAMITVPNLMKKWSDMCTVVAVKRAYSIMNNAILAMVRDNGSMEDWNWPSDKDTYFAQMLLPYLRNADFCAKGQYGKNVACISSTDQYSKYWGDFKNLDNTWAYDTKAYPSIRLANGMLIMRIHITNIPAYSRNGFIGEFIVDIDGKAGPSRRGYDYFLFGFGNRGIILNSELNAICGTQAFFRENCQSPSTSGRSCGRYVMLFGNVDYKYKDISDKWPTVGWW